MNVLEFELFLVQGGLALGGLGPVSEGLFAWLLGIGALVGIATWIAAHTARSTKQKVEL